MTYIYVASSWRNPYQQTIVEMLRQRGFEVYDFRNPIPENTGFSWRPIRDEDPSKWTYEEYRQILEHPTSVEGFNLDFQAMRKADACLMVLPCGRSAHLELGWSVGAGKETAVLYPTDIELKMEGHSLSVEEPCYECGDSWKGCSRKGCSLPGKLRRDFEPELMVKMADQILIGKEELFGWLTHLQADRQLYAVFVPKKEEK